MQNWFDGAIEHRGIKEAADRWRHQCDEKTGEILMAELIFRGYLGSMELVDGI